MFDPEEYTISVRKECIEGDTFFVGRVAEFPHLAAFEDSPEEARACILDAISTLQAVAEENGEQLPAPAPCGQEEFNGRFTLRLPKTLHARMYRLAEREGVSLNQLFVTAIAGYAGEVSGGELVASRMIQRLTTLPSFMPQSLAKVVNEAGRVLLSSGSSVLNLKDRSALVITTPVQSQPRLYGPHVPVMQ